MQLDLPVVVQGGQQNYGFNAIEIALRRLTLHSMLQNGVGDVVIIDASSVAYLVFRIASVDNEARLENTRRDS